MKPITLEWVDTNTIKPASYNPRKISKKEWDALDKSLEKFGVVEPLVVNSRTGNLVGGHQRYDVMKRKGWQEVPVVKVDLSLEDEKALNLALNKISGEWNEDKLRGLITDLSAAQYDLQYTGFDHEDIKDFFGDKYLEEIGVRSVPQEDEIVDVEAHVRKIQTGIKRGDLFKLGRHRLLCGDSHDETDLNRLFNGELAAAVFTDPPFNIAGNSTGIGNIVTDQSMIRPFFTNTARVIQARTKENGHVYVCCDWRTYPLVFETIGTYIMPKNMIVWDKINRGMGSNYMNQHELIAFFHNYVPDHLEVKDKPATRTISDANVWQVLRDNFKGTKSGERLHFAQKPLEIVQRAITNSTYEGELVADFYGGSGSTLIAAETTKRRSVLMELEPKYCQVIIDRWEKLTGGKAEKL